MMGLGSFKTQAEAAKFDLALPSKWLFSNYTHVLESGKIWLGYLYSKIQLYYRQCSNDRYYRIF